MSSIENGEKIKPQREAVIFLIYDRSIDSVWLEERLKPDSKYFGYTIVPGGKKEESDSTTDETLQREVREELGIEVVSFVLLDSFIDMSLSGNLTMHHAYLVTGFEGDVINNEIDQSKNRLFSVTLKEAKKYLELSSSRYIIDLAKKQLGVDY